MAVWQWNTVSTAPHDGATSKLSGDSGISFANGRGTLHLAMDISQQEQTNRAGPYQGARPIPATIPTLDVLHLSTVTQGSMRLRSQLMACSMLGSM